MRAMRSLLTFLVVAALALHAPRVLPQSSESMPSGLDLIKRCNAFTATQSEQDESEPDPDTVEDYGYCMGYLAGFVSGFAARSVGGEQSLFCPPEDASFRDFVDAIQRWLVEHPEGLHKLGAYVAAAAFKQQFPCPTR
jgi:hypothetical protein